MAHDRLAFGAKAISPTRDFLAVRARPTVHLGEGTQLDVLRCVRHEATRDRAGTEPPATLPVFGQGTRVPPSSPRPNCSSNGIRAKIGAYRFSRLQVAYARQVAYIVP
jgi:hypothetical protein